MWLKTVLNSLYYSGIQSVLKPYLGGVGSILMMHRVQNTERASFSPNHLLSISPEFLDQTILQLKSHGYNFISLDEVAERLRKPGNYKNTKPFLSITLDDGYRDNLEKAVPIFRRHEVPYAIYVAPGLTDNSATLWWEDLEYVIAAQNKISIDLSGERKEYDVSTSIKKFAAYDALMDVLHEKTDQYEQRQIINKLCKAYGFDNTAHVRESIMNWNEIISLSKDPLCTIGAHTINHYALSKLSIQDAKDEIVKSRQIISQKLGEEPSHFAYPYGYGNLAQVREFELAEELGFQTATTTRHGVIYPQHGNHMTALPRISINGNYQSMRYVRTLLSGVPTRMQNKGKKLNVI